MERREKSLQWLVGFFRNMCEQGILEQNRPSTAARQAVEAIAKYVEEGKGEKKMVRAVQAGLRQVLREAHLGNGGPYVKELKAASVEWLIKQAASATPPTPDACQVWEKIIRRKANVLRVFGKSWVEVLKGHVSGQTDLDLLTLSRQDAARLFLKKSAEQIEEREEFIKSVERWLRQQ